MRSIRNPGASTSDTPRIRNPGYSTSEMPRIRNPGWWHSTRKNPLFRQTLLLVLTPPFGGPGGSTCARAKKRCVDQPKPIHAPLMLANCLGGSA